MREHKKARSSDSCRNIMDMVDSTTQALNRLIYNSNTKPPEVEKTVIQRHKEKLYKRQKKGNRAAMY